MYRLLAWPAIAVLSIVLLFITLPVIETVLGMVYLLFWLALDQPECLPGMFVGSMIVVVPVGAVATILWRAIVPAKSRNEHRDWPNR